MVVNLHMANQDFQLTLPIMPNRPMGSPMDKLMGKVTGVKCMDNSQAMANNIYSRVTLSNKERIPNSKAP